MNSWNARRPPACDLFGFHKVLSHKNRISLHLPAIEDIHERDGENVGLLSPSKIGDVGIERHAL